MGEDEIGNAIEDAAKTREREVAAAFAASPRGLAERILGNAVHSHALDRLFEIWPEATVSVRRFDSRHDGVDLRVTSVLLAPSASAESGAIVRTAACHEDDQFEKRRGVDLAFRRALRCVSQLHKEGLR